MKFPFTPSFTANTITDIPPAFLIKNGIRLLMLDFDNTIVPYTTCIPPEATVSWFGALQSAGIYLCVVSNSRKDRVRKFCGVYGIDCITHSKKPFHRGINQCLEKYGVAAAQCALVGDQIYTDVLGANTRGVTSILVRAIDNHNFLLKLRHLAQLPFILPVWNARKVTDPETSCENQEKS